VVIFAGVFLYVFHSLRSLPGDAVEEGRRVLRDLRGLAEAFNQGTVEVEFTSYATSVTGTSYLQFGTVRQTEIFRRKDSASTLWGTLPLPDVVVEARAPVETTYYLDLDSQWKFVREGGVVHVLAPTPRFNTPAVDVSKIRYEVREGSLWRDTEAAKARLQEGITALAAERARENLTLVRELGRKKTEEFVSDWLLTAFGDGGEYRVEVLFRDEVPDRGEAPPLREVEREGGRSP